MYTPQGIAPSKNVLKFYVNKSAYSAIIEQRFNRDVGLELQGCWVSTLKALGK